MLERLTWGRHVSALHRACEGVDAVPQHPAADGGTRFPRGCTRLPGTCGDHLAAKGLPSKPDAINKLHGGYRSPRVVRVHGEAAMTAGKVNAQARRNSA